jgi:hypothetical protein
MDTLHTNETQPFIETDYGSEINPAAFEVIPTDRAFWNKRFKHSALRAGGRTWSFHKDFGRYSFRSWHYYVFGLLMFACAIGFPFLLDGIGLIDMSAASGPNDYLFYFLIGFVFVFPIVMTFVFHFALRRYWVNKQIKKYSAERSEIG